MEGPVGVGKTHLAGMLGERLEGRVIFEETGENPFLPLFYRDRGKHGFQAQVSFLLSRYARQSALAQPDLFSRYMISDFLFGKGLIFARASLSPEEFELYEKLAAQLVSPAPSPDLVIYLQASTGVLIDRINRFGRSFEKDMDRNWLDELVDSYNRWFLHDSSYPVLAVNTDSVDFRRDREAFEGLVKAVLNHPGGLQGFTPSISGGLKI